MNTPTSSQPGTDTHSDKQLETRLWQIFGQPGAEHVAAATEPLLCACDSRATHRRYLGVFQWSRTSAQTRKF